MKSLRLLLATLCFVVLSAQGAESTDSAFQEAQLAASEGRYRDVINVLSTVLEGDEEAAAQDRVVALANRGIAYSLLNAYELARADLRQAIAIDPGHVLSLNHLGLLAERVDQDFRMASQYFERAAGAGFAPAQVNLANLYREGRGVRQDYTQALALYQQAAQQNYSLAFVPLGRMMMKGQGVRRDRGEGLAWFARAAEAGIVEAHYELGLAYEFGNGVARSGSEAAAYYQVAAMQGHGEAQNRLGYLYRRGAGVTQDFVEAAKWYRLAADQGNPVAMNRLAWLMATCPVEAVCNGEGAIDLARESLAIERSASVLDSLAAAYARAGRFDEAISTLQEAIAMEGATASYERRLELYRRGRAYQM